MKLFYILGGGLGHLTRVQKLISMLNIEEDYLVFSTAWATKVFPEDKCIVIDPKDFENKKSLFPFLLLQLEKYSISDLYLDTFPLGLFKEINPGLIPTQCRLHYIARYLRWDAYCGDLDGLNINFNHTYIIDFLDKKQFQFIQDNAQTIHHIKLYLTDYKIKQKSIEEKFYLINHSGPQQEIEALIDLLKKHETYKKIPLPIIINTPKLTLQYDTIKVMHQYPASSLFDQAKLIVTGCGYNSMLETLPYREKHIFLPFKRRFDNQFERAKRRSESRSYKYL
ncbi:hypothetical protein [Flammeovirga sp. OC4]|uniref:hypothetical protein n=1 Tax=Flammeovirga sp. OC4 TaxID=1382345 RepID=UPI0005C54C18|nr:hypothetical protein [Flammeovirga sp. OC4]